MGIYFEEAALICAPRKGIISEIKMDVKQSATGPADFNNENFVEIYHQDGSFTRLSGLLEGSATISIGETVYPGQPIAQSSALPNASVHHVKMIQSRWKMEDGQLVWKNFLVPVFTESTGIQPSDQALEEHKVTHPFDLISKEMDKKELKNYLKK